MWIIVLNLLKNPYVIAIVLLSLLCIGLGFTTAYQRASIVNLKAEITQMTADRALLENNIKIVKGNVETVTGALKACQDNGEAIRGNVTLMQKQVEAEKKRVAYWRKMYTDKKCATNADEVPIQPRPIDDDGKPVEPSKGRVINDETNTDIVNRINVIFTGN